MQVCHCAYVCACVCEGLMHFVFGILSIIFWGQLQGFWSLGWVTYHWWASSSPLGELVMFDWPNNRIFLVHFNLLWRNALHKAIHAHTDTQQLHLLHCQCSTSDIIGEGVVCECVGAVFYSFELNGEAVDCQLLVLAVAWLGHIAIIFWGYFWCAERRRAVVWVVKMQTYKNRCFVCDCILAGSSLALALAYVCCFAFIITFCLWSTYGGVLASQPACLLASLHLDRLWKKQ